MRHDSTEADDELTLLRCCLAQRGACARCAWPVTTIDFLVGLETKAGQAFRLAHLSRIGAARVALCESCYLEQAAQPASGAS